MNENDLAQYSLPTAYKRGNEVRSSNFRLNNRNQPKPQDQPANVGSFAYAYTPERAAKFEAARRENERVQAKKKSAFESFFTCFAKTP